MASKGKKINKDEEKEPLQAVLLADDYAKRMAPVTYSIPHSLIPVANVPLIEYALELLVSAGVAQVFVVVAEHAEMVQAYLDTCSSCSQFASVEVVVAPGCKSEGQALREVDSRDKIRGDFILCSVDMVAHLKIAPALEAHKHRREAEKNKDAIVTMIMRPSEPAERQAIYPEQDLIVAVSPDNHRLVHYQSMTSKGLAMDIIGPDNAHRFDVHPNIQIRYDLEFTGIMVCSPEALCLFTDEFDWQALHKDFIPGILYSEILSYQIFTYVARQGYCSRVSSMAQYARVNADVLRRWSYPLVPDVNLFSDSKFAYYHPGVYKEPKVTLAQSSMVGAHSLIAAESSVGDKGQVSGSILGRGCLIGAGAIVEGSFLLSNVKVGAGAVVRNSMLCHNVVIGPGATVENNSVLACGVEIGEGVTVKAASRLCVAQALAAEEDDDDGFGSDDDEDDATAAVVITDEKIVGKGGKGRHWQPDALEKSALQSLLYPDPASYAFNQGDGAIVEGAGEKSDDDESDDDGAPVMSFEKEVEDIVRRGVEEAVNPDNISMEVNGRKFAHDKSFGDCAVVMLPTIFGTLAPTETRKEAFTAVTTLIETWKPLMCKFARNTSDQKECIVALEAWVTSGPWKAHKLMMPLIKACYDQDVFSDEAILDWAAEAADRGPDSVKLKEQCKQLIEYLEESEEESDDEDDE